MNQKSYQQTTFESIVANFDETVRCQSKRAKHGCRRPATWLAIHHHHRDVPTCTWHKNLWLQGAYALIAKYGSFTCGLCGKRFTGVSDTHVRFRPL